MRISLNWLKELVDIDLPMDELCHKMTMLGLEIEAVEPLGEGLSGVVVGQILSIEPHPDADKLVVCQTDVGEPEPLQIVCGAKNMKVGDKVPTAVLGATLTGGFQIKGRKMRGVESQGMMCAADELGLGEDHSGLLILDPSEKIGSDALAILGLDDVVLEIEVTPNRGDWAGMIGVARELAALLGKEYRLPDTTMKEGPKKASDLSSVTIENDTLCPRYAGRVITGIKVGPSPSWLCQRLVAAGQRPINNIVDITNLVLLETGHPLHAFDYDNLTENRIVARTPKQGEALETLDEQTRKLDTEMLIIADAKEPVAVAGVMGGLHSEVGDTTTNVFLESAYFNPASIRKTARTLAMITEASQRFQRGADPEMAIFALDRAASLMQQLGGGEVAEGRIDAYPNPLPQKKVDLRYTRTGRLLGTEIEPETQRNILKSLGFEVKELDADTCSTTVPTWRHDVAHEADLIEEIARLYGYDKMNVTLPDAPPTESILSPNDKKIRDLRYTLVGLGLTEFFSMSFDSPQAVQKAGLGEEYATMVMLENPLSENHAAMRTSLIPNTLATASLNIRRGNTNIAAFEVGPVYQPVEKKDLPNQKTYLALVLSGLHDTKHWSLPERKLDFYDLKGYAEHIFDLFGAECTLAECDHGTLQPGQCATILLRKKEIGSIGQVRPQVLEGYEVEAPVYILELDLDPLLNLSAKTPQFVAPATFPPSLRDIAVLVDADAPAGDMAAAATRAGGKLLQRADVFDIYQGEQVPEGKKSVALSLVFQSSERTLTDKETQKSWDKILRALQHQFQAELR